MMTMEQQVGENLLVSVCTITYNQERYIEQTIKGVLEQRLNFPFEFVIGDDCSTDSTGTICQRWATERPDCIRLLPRSANLGVMRNFFRVLGEARGKYIALCEGDDYWCDTDKLQKQVDYLESHPECGMVYAQVRHYDQQTNSFGITWGGAEETTFDRLLNDNCIPTPTVLFRRELLEQYIADIDPEKQGWKMGDFPMWLYFSQHSKIHFMAEVMAVYRVLESSASHFVDYRKRDAFCESSYNLRLFFARRYAPNRCRQLEEDMIYVRFLTALSYRKIKSAKIFYDALLERGADMSSTDRRVAVSRYRKRRIRAILAPWRWKE